MELSINMKLQFGDDLQNIHTAWLGYSNFQDLWSDYLHRILDGSEISKKRLETINNIKTVAVPII